MTALLGFITALLVSRPISAREQTPRGIDVYTVDNDHSILDFTVRLVGFNRIRGTFGSWSCDFAYAPAAPAQSFVSFVAEVASVNTQVAERDKDLLKPPFFDAGRVPLMRFQSHSVSGTADSLLIDGNLTIKDSTRRVRFAAHLLFPEAIDPFGNRRLVFSATVTINRRDFGVDGPKFWSLAISDSVTIEMELAGRIWDYASLDFGSSHAAVGPALMAAADSGKLDAALRRMDQQQRAEPDTAKLAGPREVVTAAMRLGQRGDWKSARRVLELALNAVGSHWPATARAAVECRLAETLFRLGDRAGARSHIAIARSLDRDDTNALAWERVIGGTREPGDK